MKKLIYIGSFSRLLLHAFGNIVNEDFINKKLPFIIYDYDEMKRNCSDVCEKLNYEYVDVHLYEIFFKFNIMKYFFPRKKKNNKKN